MTLGSASKAVAPGLRIGWLGAPAWLHPTLALLKQTLDLHTSTLDQLVVAEILGDDAFLASHLADVRLRNHRRATALCDALEGVVATRVPGGGMFCWGTAPLDTRAALPRAIEHGVAYVPGDAFSVARDARRASAARLRDARARGPGHRGRCDCADAFATT